jgi:lipopolysaccharide export LptBFGC system permease protein LptF
MSLRIFHIIFVMVSVALSLWVGVWGVRNGSIALAVVFFISAVVLAFYGTKVYAKLRDLP